MIELINLILLLKYSNNKICSIFHSVCSVFRFIAEKSTAVRISSKLNKNVNKTEITKKTKMLKSFFEIVKFKIDGDFTSKQGCIELCNKEFIFTRLPSQVCKLVF